MADKILTELVINRGTKQKFDNLPTKSPDELYFITDTETFQRKLVAGENITIDESTNTISATGGADVVHKTGDERIVGSKSFVTNVNLKDEAHALGTYSSDVWGPDLLKFSDKNNARIARVQTKYITGTNIVEVGLYATGSGTEQGIRVRSNGYTFAPTPATSSNDNSIATTAWVGTHRIIESQVPTAANGYTWYRKYADGWVEQGGTVVYGAPSASFPITMQTVHYFASAQQADGNTPGSVWLAVTRNTTNMSIYYDRYNRNTTSVVWQVSGMAE